MLAGQQRPTRSYHPRHFEVNHIHVDGRDILEDKMLQTKVAQGFRIEASQFFAFVLIDVIVTMQIVLRFPQNLRFLSIFRILIVKVKMCIKIVDLCQIDFFWQNALVHQANGVFYTLVRVTAGGSGVAALMMASSFVNLAAQPSD